MALIKRVFMPNLFLLASKLWEEIVVTDAHTLFGPIPIEIYSLRSEGIKSGFLIYIDIFGV